MTAIINATKLLRTSCNTNFVGVLNNFHTSSIACLDQGWRAKRGLVRNPCTDGPLVNWPDFTYKNSNKPTPYGIRQLKRIRAHQEHVKKILQLVSEVDYAVERHEKIMKEKEEEKKQILANKLKPKGKLLIRDT